MSKEKNIKDIEKTKRKKVLLRTVTHSRVKGGELHQLAGCEHAALTTNQGVALSDNQNSLRTNSHGPTLLEDFIHSILPREY